MRARVRPRAARPTATSRTSTRSCGSRTTSSSSRRSTACRSSTTRASTTRCSRSCATSPRRSASREASVRRSRRSGLWAALLLVLAGCATGPLTIEEELQLGLEVEQQARQKFRFVRDEVVVGYVAGLGEDLLRAMGPQPFEYDFYVIEDEELNAFAMPGGIIYVHTGLILKIG